MEITIINIITILIAVAGLFVAFLKAGASARSAHNAEIALQRNERLTSVTLVADALKSFVADKDMQTAFYAIEYDDFYYGDGSRFHKTDEERRADKLLRHFAALALAYNNGLIRREDLVLVQYYVKRILKNDEVQEYLDFLFQWAKKQGVEHPYQELVKLGKHLEKSPAV